MGLQANLVTTSTSYPAAGSPQITYEQAPKKVHFINFDGTNQIKVSVDGTNDLFTIPPSPNPGAYLIIDKQQFKKLWLKGSAGTPICEVIAEE